MEDLNTSFHALKEWAVAIKALEAGKTIMLLRKGGIHERGGCFHVPQREVLLYPTYEHQQAFMPQTRICRYNLSCNTWLASRNSFELAVGLLLLTFCQLMMNQLLILCYRFTFGISILFAIA